MISTVTIGAKDDPYPMISNVWDFFSSKGTKTSFVSVGSGKTCVSDLEFAETIGCPILKIDTPQISQQWNEVKELLKSRKPSETTSEFVKPAARKWVLPKNLIVESCIPSLYNGTINDEQETIPTKNWLDLITQHCRALALPNDEVRLDILKIDNCPYENMVLDSLWQTGIRPSLLLIHWTNNPDTDLSTLLTAAHLQMIGYCLVGKEENKFLYYYTDVNYYETCSWSIPAQKYENPLMLKLVRAINPGTSGAIQFPKAE